MLWGVPQGSVLGSLLFILYIAPIKDIIHSHGLSLLLYADDTHIYVSLKPTAKEETKARLEACLSDLRIWFVVTNFVAIRVKPISFILLLRLGFHLLLFPFNLVLLHYILWTLHLICVLAGTNT